MSIEKEILNWFATGRVGLSSKAMACAVAGMPIIDRDHPRDPADLNRCLLLLKAVPEIRQHMDKVANISPIWAELVARWDEVEQCFLDEAGLDWCKSQRAFKTYDLMKSIGC